MSCFHPMRSTGRTTLSLALVSALALTACGINTQEPAASLISAGSSSLSGIVNYHQVNSNLYRSGHLYESNMAALAGAGIKTVLSLEDYQYDSDIANNEKEWAQAQGISFIWYPLHPTSAPTAAQVKRALEYINDTANQPLLVHCKKGSDRTGIVIAAYRIEHDHWSKTDAVSELYDLGHSRSLSSWERVLDHLQ